MSQLSFADYELSNIKKITKRSNFLNRMDKVIPWKGLDTVIKGLQLYI